MERLKELAKKPWFWVAVAVVAAFALFGRRGARRATGGPQAEPMMFGPAAGGGGLVTGGPSIADRFAELDLKTETERAGRQAAMEEFAFGEDKRRAGLLAPFEALQAQLAAAFTTGQLQQEQQRTRQAAGMGFKCPPGEHPIKHPETGLVCAPLGGGGFRPFKQLGDILGGVLQGAAEAAPGATRAYIGSQVGVSRRVSTARPVQSPQRTAGFFGTNVGEWGMRG